MPVSHSSTEDAMDVIRAVTHRPLASEIRVLPTTICHISPCRAASPSRATAISTVAVPTTARGPKRRSPTPATGLTSVAARAPGSRTNPIMVGPAPKP